MPEAVSSSVCNNCSSGSVNAAPLCCNGNGNNLLECFANPYEGYILFKHITWAGLIKGFKPGMGSSQWKPTVGVNGPASSIEGTAWGVGAHSNYGGAISGLYGNWFHLGKPYISGGGLFGIQGIVPRIAYEIDLKFDEGTATGGKIRANTGNLGTTTCTSGAAYSTSSDGGSLTNGGVSGTGCMMYFYFSN